MIETSEIKNWQGRFTCLHCQQSYIVATSDINYVNLKEGTRFNPDWQYIANCGTCGWRNILTSIPSHVAIFIQFRK